MSGHLENSAICRFATGEESGAERAHAAVCAQCRGEVERFEQTLRAFRGTVRQWSADELALTGRGETSVFARPRMRSAFGTTVILTLLLLGLRLALQQPAPRNFSPADDDAELLVQVRAAVTRPVPRGLEPLMSP
jgi:hypothetical protein